MKKFVRVFSFIVIIAALAISMGACIKIEKAEPGTTSSQAPANTGGLEIKSFQASPVSVKPGDSVTLAWDVSGADKVSINPEVGPVNTSGIATVKPTMTTTYVLEAQGVGGTVSKSVTVNVQAVAMQPDLVVTEVSIKAKEVYFTAKNVGNAPSPGCRAYLYLDGTKLVNGDTYVDPLKPGEEKTIVFGKYEYQEPSSALNLPTPLNKLIQWEFKVCVDVEETVSEVNEKNNCKAIIMGQEFLYSFYEKAHLASWTTGAGKLVWPVPENSAGGSAFTTEGKVLEDNQAHSRILATYPQQVSGGWISGTYADFYTNELRQATSRLLVLLPHCKFVADVGFTREAPASAKAKFIFTVLDQGGMPIYKKEISATRNGSLDSFDEDLSSFAGATCTLVLRVESGGNPGDDLTVWADPRIIQKW